MIVATAGSYLLTCEGTAGVMPCLGTICHTQCKAVDARSGGGMRKGGRMLFSRTVGHSFACCVLSHFCVKGCWPFCPSLCGFTRSKDTAVDMLHSLAGCVCMHLTTHLSHCHIQHTQHVAPHFVTKYGVPSLNYHPPYNAYVYDTALHACKGVCMWPPSSL